LYIYKIVNKINNKVYVGQTVQSIEKRWNCHKCDSQTANFPLYRAIRKYGIDNFAIEHIETLPENSTVDDLNQREIFWIKELNSVRPNGYNLKSGGSHGRHSEESKIKMRIAHTGKKLSNEHKIKLGIAGTGRTHSKETLAKMSATKRGKVFSKEHRAKLSAAKKGKKLTEEHKAKIAATNKGRSRSLEIL